MEMEIVSLALTFSAGMVVGVVGSLLVFGSASSSVPAESSDLMQVNPSPRTNVASYLEELVSGEVEAE
jgi:hypothetical protein